MQKNTPITIGGITVQPGERKTIDLVVGKLYTHSELTMPVQVLCGRQAGPVLFVCAAVHGDELNGVEIIRRLLKVKSLNRLKGTLIAVPIVNLHGFIHHSRYLPDRRDLNRSFPGSEKGSVASRMAYLFLNEVVAQSTHGIDIHTGAINRTNLPQIRAMLDDPETLNLAQAFGAPLILNSELRPGSLRAATVKKNIPVLLYEAGEALRFDEVSIRAGVRGIINVMRELNMITKSRTSQSSGASVVARSSFWMRAPHSGIFRSLVPDGKRVIANQTLMGIVSDPFGESEIELYAPNNGIVIGQMRMPLVNEGEALYHIAKFARSDIAADVVDEFTEEISDEAPYYSDDFPVI
ncbi:succinylglutamate desuccinylase/aspartoacylase family protein [Hydrogenovibrio kuenenii]|uniref:succinylglutamate desuccinylase/aspartoacylase family protein n=1 Tax=Hydrogenovibrio kuenenii TaxID=63658 RepID=UPI000462F472|nr:succinylglutamate desuccinylase/aspartoacylase family protein [Hydrogenovibrio kuenenii]